MLEGGTKEKETGEVSSGTVEFHGGREKEVNEIQTIMVNLTRREQAKHLSFTTLCCDGRRAMGEGVLV